MNILTVVILAEIILLGVMGAVRGLIRTALNLVSIIISVILVYILAPVLGNYVIEHSNLDDKINDKMYNTIRREVKEKADKISDALDFDTERLAYPEEDLSDDKRREVIAEYIMSSPLNKADQVKVIDNLDMPEFLDKSLKENNNRDIYNDIGADNFFQYISKYTARVVVRIIVTIAFYIVCRVLFFILIYLFTGAVRQFKLLNAVDRIGGAAAGMVMGIAAAWGILLDVYVLMSYNYNVLVNASSILQLFDKTNLFAMRVK